MNGVKAVRVVAEAGKEIQWDGQEIAAVAATTEEVARDAVRKIKVEYEVLPHLVNEDDLARPASRAKAAGEKVTGDPDKAFQEADAVSEGIYGIPVITHCCLEPHGTVIQWEGDQVTAGLHPERLRHRRHPGPTSRFLPPRSRSRWITSAAASAASSPRSLGRSRRQPLQKAGGKPVKLFLDRATELKIAGQPPLRLRQDQGRRQEGRHHHRLAIRYLGHRRLRRRRLPPLPYVFTNIPNKRLNHIAVSVNAGRRGLARAQPSAGLLPHLLRPRRSGRQARCDPGGLQ